MSKLLEALAVMAELTGTDWSKPAIQVIERELSAYSETDVITAIRKCQGELRHRATLADILDRIPSQHPGVEAAWAIIAPKVSSDIPTVFVTDEMREAFGAALALEDDMIAARMAFKEVYEQAVSRSRALGHHAVWSPIFGTDRNSKEAAILEAVKRGQITTDWAKRNLPVEAHESLLTFATSQQIARR